MKTENEENLEKVRKEGVRMRGQGEGGRKEGKEIRKEEGWRMSIFHLILSFSSFFCKTLFFLSFLTSVFHPQLFSTFPLSFLTYLPFFSLCFLYFSVFLSFLPSSFPPVLSTLIISSPPPSSSTFSLFISFLTFPLYSPSHFFPYFLILSCVFLYISSISFLSYFTFFSSCFLYFCLPFRPHFVFLLSF